MNAPFDLKRQLVPTTERPAFKEAMDAARTIKTPTRAKVLAWAEKMKKALNG